MELLGAWGHRWAQTSLDKENLDAGLLMWDMRRSVDPAVFPTRRIIIQFKYPDAPRGARAWWLISEKGEIDLCLSDPGHEVDIIIQSSLKTMTEVWVCQRPFRAAVKAGDINVKGDSRLTNKLQDWLRASMLSRLGSLAEIPELAWNLG